MLKIYHLAVMLKKDHLIFVWKKLYTYIRINFLKVEICEETNLLRKKIKRHTTPNARWLLAAPLVCGSKNGKGMTRNPKMESWALSDRLLVRLLARVC